MVTARVHRDHSEVPVGAAVADPASLRRPPVQNTEEVVALARRRYVGNGGVRSRPRWCDTREVDDALSTLCPACGFDAGEPPWQGGGGSHEICLSCGLQFGYQDSLAKGDPENAFYHGWRSCWLTHGAPWSGHGSRPPPNWDPKEQVRRFLRL